jgi:hypothetical protein
VKRIWLTLGSAALAALACAALPAIAGAATTRYASPTGLEGAPCTRAEPCDIHTAAEGPAVANGDEAVLLPGTYELSKTLLVARAVLMHGEAGAPRPVIESTAIEGLTVANSGALVEGIESRDSHGGGTALDLGGGTVDGVVAVDTGDSGTACFLPPELPLVLRDSACLATGEGGYGVMSTITTTESRIARLRNVTAIALGPHSTGIYVTAAGTPPGSVMLDGLDVIASGTEFDAAAFASTGSPPAEVALSHSNFDTRHQEENGTVTAPGSGTNQTAPPLLANPVGGDFRELPRSPTIDAGATDPFTGALDLEGAPRLQGAAPDIGAAEFTPLPPPPTPLNTKIVRAKVKRKKHRARFSFTGSGGSGGLRFRCRLDKGKFSSCRTPRLYKHLKKGRHVFRVRAVDATGAVDPTPAKRRFRI